MVLTALLAGGVAWLRMPVEVAGQLYAEDGPLFLGQAATDGISTLLAPYAGYQHLLPRLLSAAITTAVPVASWAVAANVAVCLVIGLIAGLVAVCSRDVTRSPVLSVLLGLVPALVPVAQVEAIGNLANLHWFSLYALVWVLLATPRSMIGAWLLALAALLATLSETQALLLLPVVLWRLREDGRRVWPISVAWATGSLVQVAAYLTAPRVLPTGRPPVASVVDGYVVDVVVATFSIRPRVLGWAFRNTGLWGGATLTLLCVCLGLLGAVVATASARVAVVGLFYGSLASWTASFVLGANPDLYFSEIQPTDWTLLRWGTAASMLFVAAVLVSLDAIGGWWRPLQAPAAAARWGIAGLLVLGAPFAVSAGDDTWAARIGAARVSCASGADEVTVTSAPALGWQMRLPCALLR